MPPAKRQSSSERRRAPRIPVTLLVQHRQSATEPPETDYATDLSEYGLFLKTRASMIEGDTLQITFAPKKDASLVEAYCRVARVTQEGVGAEFIQLDGDAAVLLARALQS